jgi:hypothetical protein
VAGEPSPHRLLNLPRASATPPALRNAAIREAGTRPRPHNVRAISGRQDLRQRFARSMNGKWSTSHMVACPDVISLEPEAARVMWKMEYWSQAERRGTVVYANGIRKLKVAGESRR